MEPDMPETPAVAPEAATPDVLPGIVPESLPDTPTPDVLPVAASLVIPDRLPFPNVEPELAPEFASGCVIT
jgi:hypothetical protein